MAVTAAVRRAAYTRVAVSTPPSAAAERPRWLRRRGRASDSAPRLKVRTTRPVKTSAPSRVMSEERRGWAPRVIVGWHRQGGAMDVVPFRVMPPVVRAIAITALALGSAAAAAADAPAAVGVPTAARPFDGRGGAALRGGTVWGQGAA